MTPEDSRSLLLAVACMIATRRKEGEDDFAYGARVYDVGKRMVIDEPPKVGMSFIGEPGRGTFLFGGVEWTAKEGRTEGPAK